VLSIFVFTADLSETFVDITAPLYYGNANTKSVSFMFVIDENTAAENVEKIVSSLKNARSGATFFIRGSWAANNIELTKKLADEYELGNYGFTNTNLNGNNAAKIKSEIENCHNMILGIANVKMKFFTPPDQKYNKTTLSAAESLGYTTVLPTKQTTAGYKSGDLILLPADTDTVYSIDKTISGILSQNIFIVSVGDNIG
jgi:peptidoglycan/xylan/chitin deacetylase (PgdA/CDA1 family)